MKTTINIVTTFLIVLGSFKMMAKTTPEFMNGTGSSVSFMRNQGQWIPDIIYKTSHTSTSIALLNDGISFCNAGAEIENPDGSEVHTYFVWNLKFLNASLSKRWEGDQKLESKISFLFGNDPSQWVIHPDEFAALNCKDIYNKIDLKFYGESFDLKYDFIVHPGGDINSIQSAYDGVEELKINSAGELEVQTLWHTQIQRTPVAWQYKNGVKHLVDVEYVLLNDTTYGFSAKKGYDKNYDLVIDPLFQMAWASYTNIPGSGNNINYCFANEMDNAGNVYLTGMADGTFPITPGAYSGPGTVYPDIFVAKYSSDGTTLLYGTYLPANSAEFGTDIAVDSLGRAYVTGIVNLNITGITNFPSTTNAFQPVHGGSADAFLTVLNPTGTGLVYSTFLGGTGGEDGYGVTLGANGIAYVTGYTTQGNFPVKASQVFTTGDNDVFVSKFDINQSGNNSLIYSTRIGGGSFSLCQGRSIAINSSGNVFVTGTVSNNSTAMLYPTSPGAYNNVYDGGTDGRMVFVTKLSSTLPISIDYSTFIGPGTGNAIAVNDATDEVFVAGTTYTTTYPVTSGVLQPVHALMEDAFVTKLNSAGSALLYSTFLGGDWSDLGTGLAINSAGEAYVSGITQDLFPTSPGSIQPLNAGTYDFFVVNLNSSGTGYGCGGSTYVGGSDADYSGSFYDYPSPKVSILDHGGNGDTILISSTSHSIDFPTTAGTYGPVKINGIADQPVFFKMTCFAPGATPDVVFNSADSAWCDKDRTDFYDFSINNPTSWQWYFPGAFPSTSNLQNPIGIYYSTPGVYDVTLVACNQFGCDSTTIVGYITEYAAPAIPIVTIGVDTLFSSIAFAYQWYDGLTSIAGATNSFFVPTQPGSYSVMILDENGCDAISNTVLFTSIKSVKDEKQFMEIYPNPVSGNVVLSFDLAKAEKVSVLLFDDSGRKVNEVYIGNLSSGKHEIDIDISDFARGIYILELKTDSKLIRSKLIVQ